MLQHRKESKIYLVRCGNIKLPWVYKMKHETIWELVIHPRKIELTFLKAKKGNSKYPFWLAENLH